MAGSSAEPGGVCSSNGPRAAERGIKTFATSADKGGMKMAASAIDGIHRAEALLGYSANRRVGETLGSSADVVTLSDVAVAMIQARIGMTASVSAFRDAPDIHTAMTEVMG